MKQLSFRKYSIPVFSSALIALAVGFSSPFVAAAQTISASYCITGTGTGVDWGFAWEYDDGSTTTHLDGASQLPAGATCGDFAQAFADTMNMVAWPTNAYVVTVTGCCLTITMGSGWNWDDLWVGPVSNTTNCLVTTSGCSFNPTIALVEPPVGIDLRTWGTVKYRY